MNKSDQDLFNGDAQKLACIKKEDENHDITLDTFLTLIFVVLFDPEGPFGLVWGFFSKPLGQLNRHSKPTAKDSKDKDKTTIVVFGVFGEKHIMFTFLKVFDVFLFFPQKNRRTVSLRWLPVRFVPTTPSWTPTIMKGPTVSVTGSKWLASLLRKCGGLAEKYIFWGVKSFRKVAQKRRNEWNRRLNFWGLPS